MEEKFTEQTLRDFYYVLFRHKKKILIFFFIVVIAFSVQVYNVPDFYLSEASLIVTAGRENIEMIPTAGSAATTSRSSNLNTEIEILRSREVIEGVIDKIGIESFLVKKGNNNNIIKNPGHSEKKENNLKYSNTDIKSVNNSQNLDLSDEIVYIRENIILNLIGNIDLSIARGTNIINISYQSRNPELSQKVVSTLIDVFIEKRTNIHYSSSSFDFFNKQTKQHQETLNKIEEQIVVLKNKFNIGSLEEYRSNLMSRIEARNQEVVQNNDAIAETESKIEFIKNQLKNIPVSNESETMIDSENIRSELNSLHARLRELLTNYSEENIQVKEVRRQIAETQKLIRDKSQINDDIYTNYQQLYQDIVSEQKTLVSLQAKKDALNKRPSNSNEEISKLNTYELEISRLERERNHLYESYNKYASNLEEAQIDQIVQNQNISNIRILQSATLPMEPVAKRKFRNLALGLFIGFFGSIGLALVFDYMDHSIKKQGDVEKWLQLRMLVSIPERTE